MNFRWKIALDGDPGGFESGAGGKRRRETEGAAYRQRVGVGPPRVSEGLPEGTVGPGELTGSALRTD